MAETYYLTIKSRISLFLACAYTLALPPYGTLVGNKLFVIHVVQAWYRQTVLVRHYEMMVTGVEPRRGPHHLVTKPELPGIHHQNAHQNCATATIFSESRKIPRNLPSFMLGPEHIHLVSVDIHCPRVIL